MVHPRALFGGYSHFGVPHLTVRLNQLVLKDFAASQVSPKQSQPRCPKTRSPHLAPFIARMSWLEALFGIKGKLRH
jgi:hypothetical protein